MIQCKVIFLISDTGCMRENHFQSNRYVRVMWISDLETDQIADIVIQRENSLVYQLQKRSSRKGFRNGSNSHDILIGQRSFSFQILVSKRFVIHNLTILYYSSRNTYRLEFIHNFVDSLASEFFTGRATSCHQQQ